MTDYLGRRAGDQPGHRRSDPGGPAGLPDSHHDRRPAGRHRHRRAWTGPCGPTSSPRAARRSRWPATSTRCCWTRPARSRSATARRRSSCPWASYHGPRTGPAGGPGLYRRPDARGQEHRRTVRQRRRLVRRSAAMPGRILARTSQRRPVRRVHRPDPHERHRPARRPTHPQGRRRRHRRLRPAQGGSPPPRLQEQVDAVASQGATPLLVCEGNRLAGMVVLEDILKPGIAERFERLRRWACGR